MSFDPGYGLLDFAYPAGIFNRTADLAGRCFLRQLEPKLLESLIYFFFIHLAYFLVLQYRHYYSPSSFAVSGSSCFSGFLIFIESSVRFSMILTVTPMLPSFGLATAKPLSTLRFAGSPHFFR